MIGEIEHRKSLQESLKIVEKDILEMTEMAKEGVVKSIEAMENYEKNYVDRVYEIESETNELNLDVEKTCLKIVALHQPVASDLRFVASTMKIADILERICDLTMKIAQLAEKKKNEKLLKPLEDTRKIVNQITKMINIVKEAINNKEVKNLRSLSENDDIIDELFAQIQDELVEIAFEQKEKIPKAMDLLYMARYLERIGDLVCNIGARMIYYVEGERVRIK